MKVKRSVTRELILEAWKSMNLTSFGWFSSEYLNRILDHPRSPWQTHPNLSHSFTEQRWGFTISIVVSLQRTQTFNKRDR